MKVPNIRFNLKFYSADGNEVAIRTLADLAENLNLSDLWDYFASDDLERWLRSVGEQEKAEEVRALGGSRRSVLEDLRELCRVLGLEVSEESLERFASMQDRRRDKERDAEGAIESEREEAEYLSCFQRVLDNRCDLRRCESLQSGIRHLFQISGLRQGGGRIEFTGYRPHLPGG